MSKISVLIPSFEPGEYIFSCLQSIERQTLSKSRFEVYIALNGSGEEYAEYLSSVLRGFSFSYHFFVLEKPGVSSARNFLIEASGEEYISFIDDDDIVSSNYLEELLGASSSNVMGVSNIYNFSSSLGDLSESYIGRCFKRLPNITFSKFKSRKYYSSPCAKLIHRNIIGNVRFDENLSTGEDALFMAHISTRVVAVKKTSPSACYYVYERSGSVTRSQVDKAKEFRRILYLMKEYGKMLLSPKHDKLLVLARIAATVMHVKRIISR